MIDWDDCRVALALQRAGTVRGAALALGVNHATVSRRLAALNEGLGARLFERADGIYRPTDAGQMLIASAIRMEEAVHGAERSVAGLDSRLGGRVTLSLPDAVAQYLLIDALGDFETAFPDIDLLVLTSHEFVNLDRREADVVVRITNTPPDHLVGRRLFKYVRSCYAAPRYLANQDPVGNPAAMRWIGWPEDSDMPDWVRQTGYPTTPVGLRIENMLLRHAAACAGRGLILDACFMADPEPGLVRLPNARPHPDRDIWVLVHPDLKEVARVRMLARHLTTALAAKRDLIEGRCP